MDCRTDPPYRILVVDDESAIRQLNTELLMDAGYEVDSAGDGLMAWKCLQQNRYDLLIMDNEMPQRSGVELLKKLHEAREPLPAIMATGTMPTEAVRQHSWFQLVTILLKPYMLDELLSTVKSSLELPKGLRRAA